MSRKLQVEIIGDASSLQKALGKSAIATESFGSKLLKVGKIAAIAGGAAGIGALTYGLVKSIQSASDHQKAMAQTEAVVKSTGGAANVTAEQIAKLADATEKKTGVDDLAIQSGENMLLTFTNIRNEVGKGNAIFDKATTATLDLSVAMGKDMASSAILVGKALNDPVKGLTSLTRVGVSFTEGQRDAIKAMVESGNVMGAQKIIIGELTKEFGGSAEAAGKTFGGQLNILKARLDDVAQRVGEKLLPALTRAVGWINDNWGQISAVFDTVANGIGAAMQFAANLVGQAVAAIRAHWTEIRTTAETIGRGAFEVVKTAAQGFLNFIRSDFGQSVAIGAVAMFGLVKAITAIRGAVQIANTALLALKSNPLFLALAGISLVIGIFAQKWLAAKFAVDQFAISGDAGANVINRLKAAMDGLKDTATTLKDANLQLTTAQIAHQRAVQNFQAVQASDTATALDRKEAYAQVLATQREVERATGGVADATKKHTAAQKENTAALSDSGTEFNKYRDKASAVSAALQEGKISTDKAKQSLINLHDQVALGTGKLLAHAQSLEKTNPAAAKAERGAALYGIQLGKLLAAFAKDPSKGATAFFEGIQKLQEKAKEGGKGATDKLGEALSKTGKTVAAAAKHTAAVKAPLKGLYGAGYAAGVSGGKGVADGLVASTPGAVAAARRLNSLVKQEFTTRFGSEPKEWAAKNVGDPLVRGIALGIYQAMPEAKNAVGRLKNQLKATMQAAEVVAAMRVAGKVIGEANARGIVEGFIDKQPSLKQQMITALKQVTALGPEVDRAGRLLGAGTVQGMINELIGKTPSLKAQFRKMVLDALTGNVEELRTKFGEVFGSFADAATAAFNAKIAAWKAPSQIILDNLAQQDIWNQIGEAFGTGATDALDSIKVAFESGQPGMAAAITKTLISSIDAAIGEAKTRLDQANAELAAAQAAAAAAPDDPAAQERLRAAEEAATGAETAYQKEVTARNTALTELARLETEAHNTKVAEDQKRFEKDLGELNKALQNQNLSVQEKHNKILAFLRNNGLGAEVAKELRGKLKAVETAADELATAIKNRLSFTTTVTVEVVTKNVPPGGIPGKALGGHVFAGQPYIVGERGPELFLPGTGGNIIPNGATAVASAGGYGAIHVHVGTVIGNDLEGAARELAGPLRRELTRHAQRNR